MHLLVSPSHNAIFLDLQTVVTINLSTSQTCKINSLLFSEQCYSIFGETGPQFQWAFMTSTFMYNPVTYLSPPINMRSNKSYKTLIYSHHRVTSLCNSIFLVIGILPIGIHGCELISTVVSIQPGIQLVDHFLVDYCFKFTGKKRWSWSLLWINYTRFNIILSRKSNIRKYEDI